MIRKLETDTYYVNVFKTSFLPLLHIILADESELIMSIRATAGLRLFLIFSLPFLIDNSSNVVAAHSIASLNLIDLYH